MTSANGNARFAWVDVAKGFCIALVVFLHISRWHYHRFSPDQATFWFEFMRAFAPLRMPLFFFISGFLASGGVQRSLASNFHKTVGLFLIYVFWETTLRIFWGGMSAAGGDLDVNDWVQETVQAMILPASLWYLWALPVFCLIAWVLHRLLGRHAVWALLPFAALSIYAPFMAESDADGGTQLPSVAANLVWFYCGIHGRAVWQTLLERATWRRFLIGSALYVALFLTVWSLGVAPYFKFFLAPVALFAASQFLGVANLSHPIAVMFAHIGQMTLPVYVMHLLGISVLGFGLKLSGLTRILQDHVLIGGLLFPVILTPLVIFACRMAGSLILKTPAKPILEPVKLPERREATVPAKSAR